MQTTRHLVNNKVVLCFGFNELELSNMLNNKVVTTESDAEPLFVDGALHGFPLDCWLFFAAADPDALRAKLRDSVTYITTAGKIPVDPEFWIHHMATHAMVLVAVGDGRYMNLIGFTGDQVASLRSGQWIGMQIQNTDEGVPSAIRNGPAPADREIKDFYYVHMFCGKEQASLAAMANARLGVQIAAPEQN